MTKSEKKTFSCNAKEGTYSHRRLLFLIMKRLPVRLPKWYEGGGEVTLFIKIGTGIRIEVF